VTIAELQIALAVQWLGSRESSAPEGVAEALVALSRAAVPAMLRCDRPATHV